MRNKIKKILEWWRGTYPVFDSVHVRMVEKNVSDLTLAEWIKHDELVHEAHQLAQTPTFKAMVEVLKNESPANYKMPKGSQPTDLVVHLGEIDGYNMAINNMLAMTVQHEKLEPLVASFEAEKEQTL